MRNLRLILSYDGGDFAGWQVQPGRATVQGTLASAIGRLSGENVLPQGSGRTDAGVHALAQVASFTTASQIPAENWRRALNDILPASIRVLDVTDASPEFHARKSARAKTYRYRILRAAICSPFLARYVWHYPYPLEESAMIAAAGAVVGEHDFTSFAGVDPERSRRMAEVESTAMSEFQADNDGVTDPGRMPAPPMPVRSMNVQATNVQAKNVQAKNVQPTNIRTIFSSDWRREGDELIYTIRGNGFLHHMVRNLVGTFLLVGKETLSLQDLSSILDARNRTAAGPTAPAAGLSLVEVEY